MVRFLNTSGLDHGFEHVQEEDAWIAQGGGLEQRFRALHAEIQQWPGLERLHRIAIATYDNKFGLVRTFAQSNTGAAPLERFSGRLADYPELLAVADTGRPVIQHELLRPGNDTGSKVGIHLAEQGFRSRYTCRLHRNGTLYGFIFFNSRQPGFFTDAILSALVPYRRLIDVLVVSELTSTRAMLAAVHTALEVSHYRDEETGTHLERMSHYAHIIAAKIASRHGLSDEYIEFILQYAPLHDVGKVAIPDSILLKPGKLTPEEFNIMKTHVTKGVEIIDAMIHNHGLGMLPHVSMLRNVVGCHHEAFDGSGYPSGRLGEDIPLEGRIVAVADVFDALTSQRPYKAAWSNAEAASFLIEQAGKKFDAQCVHALLSDMDAIANIQKQFQDTPHANIVPKP